MNIVSKLKAFNQVRDAIMLEVSSTLLLLGFVVGTVDVLTRGTLTTNAWFQSGWAVVQALTVDVLFFALWGRIARLKWGWRTMAANVAQVAIGLLLAGIAALVNGLVNAQQLFNLPSIAAAMDHLHIDQTAFTIGRSGLIVALAILVALFCRAEEKPEQPAGAPLAAEKTLVTAPDKPDVQAWREQPQPMAREPVTPDPVTEWLKVESEGSANGTNSFRA